jgi:hypothetical protein
MGGVSNQHRHGSVAPVAGPVGAGRSLAADAAGWIGGGEVGVGAPHFVHRGGGKPARWLTRAMD